MLSSKLKPRYIPKHWIFTIFQLKKRDSQVLQSRAQQLCFENRWNPILSLSCPSFKRLDVSCTSICNSCSQPRILDSHFGYFHLLFTSISSWQYTIEKKVCLWIVSYCFVLKTDTTIVFQDCVLGILKLTPFVHS